MKNINDKIQLEAVDLLDFAAFEQRSYLVTFANNREEVNIITHIQELFRQAMQMKDFDESEISIPQLLVFVHYNFLYSMSSFMRGHVGHAFSALRVSLDAGFAAAFIIQDRKLQTAYYNRTAPFDKLNRKISNLPGKGAEIHPLIPKLKKLYDMCSEQSHADIQSFAHRLNVTNKDGKSAINVEYFQFIKNEYELKATFLNLSQSFLPILEIFSDFLIKEKRMVNQEWLDEIRAIGMAMTDRIEWCKSHISLEGKRE